MKTAVIAIILAVCAAQAQPAPLKVLLLINDDRNAVDICYNAADGLAMLATPEVVEAFKEAAISHPIKSVQLIARECLHQHGVAWEQTPSTHSTLPAPTPASTPATPCSKIVFIRGDLVIPASGLMDPWRQVYGFNDNAP